MGLLDVLQGASNAAASNVSAPVDAIAWLLRKAGVPIPQDPVLGSQWMADKGLTAQPKDAASGLLGETLGMAAPFVAAAKAPQIAAGILQGADNLAAPSSVPFSSQRGAVMIKNRQRTAFPGIYKRPDQIAAEAAQRVAPENPAMQRLFGVTRDDLYEQAYGRTGNIDPILPGAAANPTGSAAAQSVMTPANSQRLVDALAEAEKYPNLIAGSDAWYNMQPAYARLVELVGPDAAPAMYRRFNTLTGMASPGSDVLTELNRGTAANWLANTGRFDDFVRYGGKAANARGADFPDDLRGVLGHPYHSTAQATPMRAYLDTGAIQMESPKVPMYIQASGVPETGFQTAMPVGDAHWSRAVGLADTRTNKAFAASVSNPEMAQLGPWWRANVADAVGLDSVPAQARAWNVFGPQTGVDTPLGAPKLELLSQQIMKAADRMGVTPELARDMILTGRAHAGYITPELAAAIAAGGAGALAAMKFTQDGAQ